MLLKHSWKNPSFDKIYPNLGYVKGNVISFLGNS